MKKSKKFQHLKHVELLQWLSLWTGVIGLIFFLWGSTNILILHSAKTSLRNDLIGVGIGAFFLFFTYQILRKIYLFNKLGKVYEANYFEFNRVQIRVGRDSENRMIFDWDDILEVLKIEDKATNIRLFFLANNAGEIMGEKPNYFITKSGILKILDRKTDRQSIQFRKYLSEICPDRDLNIHP